MRIPVKVSIIAAAATLTLCAGILFLLRQNRGDRGVEQQESSPAPGKGSKLTGTGPGELLALLSTGQSAAAMKVSLARLKAVLLTMPPSEAVAWVNAYLKEGGDLQTGLGFVLSSDQSLQEWPSLRVFLLDALMAIDPAAAVQAGREVLGSPTSADEWALALRNVARGSTAAEDTALLKTKCAELLRNAAWRANPSAGYLEAFDVIVHTRHTALAPELLSLTADKDHRAVRHAAFLTLDRLVQTEPATVLAMLLKGDAPPDTGLMISNMIARADVRDAAQRGQVETWLRDERRTAAELQAFAGVFPNANQMVSPNLVTPVATVQGTDLAAKDRAALEVVNAWIADPALARSHGLLRGTHARLKEFVK